ncbi:hypothetical protein CCZ28_02785 [Pseudomonas oryzihabitans]|nr:hypothetical protein CCZ28_02785 [Pseudomonas psychrotolerans]
MRLGDALADHHHRESQQHAQQHESMFPTRLEQGASDLHEGEGDRQRQQHAAIDAAEGLTEPGTQRIAQPEGQGAGIKRTQRDAGRQQL